MSGAAASWSESAAIAARVTLPARRDDVMKTSFENPQLAFDHCPAFAGSSPFAAPASGAMGKGSCRI
jgi:hypothetical protein